jgi:TrmH family RNA methyltransferase
LELASRRNIPIRQVEERHAKRYFSTRTPQGVGALVHRPEPRPLADFLTRDGRVLILDGLQDPGNAGTLIRTAWLLGWESVLLTKGSVSPWNEKAVRASAGAVTFLPVAVDTAAAIRDAARAASYDLLLAAPAAGKPPERSVSNPKGLALILGGEAHGADSTWPGAATVTIPIRSGKGLDSLGVVASGAILLERYRR